ncbi:MAG: alpha/beta fold hydrolase [Solirubrobacterales bacterium]
MPVLERYVDLPQARVRVLERGGDGPAVIFLHGLTSSASTWRPQLERLPEGVRGIAYDGLGSGYTTRSGPRAPITRDEQRALLLAVADELGAESFRAVGHSMGCGPALGAAWRHPERVSALLLTAPSTQGRRVLGPTIRMARFGPTARLMELAAPLYVPAMARATVKELGAGELKPELLEREAGHAIARPREQVRGFVDIAGHGDLRSASPESEHYREITRPIWILRGAGDRDWMPESHEERYRELLPAAHLIRWEDVGHSPHIEAPERFTRLLRDFLVSKKKRATRGREGAARADERGIS